MSKRKPRPVRVTCEYFVLCTRPADGAVRHPIIGLVPTCKRCADKLGLKLEPLATPEAPAS